MSETIAELPKGYEPAQVEARWYPIWLENKLFEAQDISDKPPFCIIHPPPNVTGSLHMGHALTATIQDVLIRWKRMSGFNALWLHGTDHAGIATQMLVERELKKTEQKSRHDIGREEFLRRVWQWKEKHGGRINEQLKVLGASFDWRRERFTMDEQSSRAVREVFVRLYEEGLMYRAHRLINWCPQDRTALSDLEVEHEENQKGELFSFAYPLADGAGEIVVATTRPETMLGDTAVAVHPDDERYKALIGKNVKHPITGREFPIVGDAILVDPAFGTGAVKVTPAHDFNDFEVGKRHGLPSINLLTPDGKLNENGGPFAGLDRFEAREQVKQKLEELGLTRGTKEHLLAIGRCQRCRTIVEPYLSDQWFVKIKPLAEPAIEAVKKGDTVFIPETWTNTYMSWMTNILDWCVSRQLWWGHQIPAWYCPDGHVNVARTAPSACATCSSSELKQDEDVLDTWFSSALWPFSTLGWPEQTASLKTFYPGSVMETGFDIIFFWVARMMMMGIHFNGEVPFRTVFLHAMVRDEKGEKMSKTKGNVIDPLDVTATYGADALRFTLASMTAQGRDIKLSLDRVGGYKAFANKLWNAARFSLLHMANVDTAKPLDEARLSDADRWILARYHRAAADVIASLEAFRFNDACSRVYSFVWHELCDWYIELCKPRLYDGAPEDKATSARVLRDVMDGALRLLHPFMPFVTEEIWQKLPRLPGDPKFLAAASYPAPLPRHLNDVEADRFDTLIEVVKTLRSLRVDLSVPEGAEIEVVFDAEPQLAAWIAARTEWVTRLAKVKSMRRRTASAPFPPKSPAAIAAGVELRVPIAGLVNREELLAKLAKDAEKLRAELGKVRGRLDNPSFVQRAPPEVVEKDRALAEELAMKLEKVEENRDKLSSDEEEAPAAEAAPPGGVDPAPERPILDALQGFVSSLVQDEDLRNHLNVGLGHLGAGRVDDAVREFGRAAKVRGLLEEGAAAVQQARKAVKQAAEKIAYRKDRTSGKKVGDKVTARETPKKKPAAKKAAPPAKKAAAKKGAAKKAPAKKTAKKKKA